MAKAVSFSVASMDYFPDRGEDFAGGNALNQGIQLKEQFVADVIFSGGHLGMVEELRLTANEADALIVLTLGAQGSMATAKDKVYRQNVLPIDKVIDTTGCGDAFQAAFSGEYFRTRNIEGALLGGARAGREVAGRYGAAEWF
jgi:fructoselysine 6-kinase